MITVNKANPTAAEERTSLVNASDGAGLHFDGSAGSINGTSNLALGSKYSAEFVINYTGSAENRLFDINGDTRFIVEFNRSGFTGKIAGYDSGFYEICDIPDDGVFHLVVTVDGTAVSAYINGNLAGTATKNNSTSIDTVTQWTIGANVGGSGSEFEGTIYRARFYNHTLSSAEVQTAYERADVDFSSQYGSQTTINSGTTTSGKRYRITARDGVDFTTVGAADNNVGTEFLATGSVTLDANDTVVQIGAVVDLDLAFANENQSRMVADRSTNNVDGEMSSSGVKQTQVIKQLNSTAMRVGGTSATPLTPADGEIIAGSVTAKPNTTTGGVVIDASGQTDTTARLELKADRPSADQDACDIRFYNNNAQPIAVIAAVKGSGANDTDGKLDFYTSNAKRLTIDSTGDITLPTAGQTIKTDLSSGGTTRTGIIELYNGSTGALSLKTVNSATGGIELWTEGTKRLDVQRNGVCAFSNGIAFSQTNTSATGATATGTTLDHYEAGTFTATLNGLTGEPATLVTATANYTRVGDRVFFSIGFENADTTGYSGTITITGLPFANAGVVRAPISVITYDSATWTSGTQAAAFVGRNHSYISMYAFSSGGVWNALQHDAGTGRYFWLNGTYRTAAA